MLNSLVKQFESQASANILTSIRPIKLCNHNRSDTNRMKLELYFYKMMHFKLWELAQTINRIFGWIFVVFLSQFFSMLIYILVHSWLILLDLWNYQDILRKIEVRVVQSINWRPHNRHLFSITGLLAVFIGISTAITIFLDVCHRCALRVSAASNLFMKMFIEY